MLREDLQKALKESMLAKDTQKVGAIRLIIAGMKEKDVDARGKGLKEASETDLMSMMQNMIKQRRDSIDMYLKGNRQDLADKEQAEIAVIETFLPKQMNDEEMLALKAKYAGQMDMGKVSGIIKTLF